MPSTIEIENQSFDTAIEHFRFQHYHHRIEDMSELAKLRLLPRLTSANFEGTNLDDRGLMHVVSVPTIDWLDLQGTQISNDGLAHLAALPRLSYLRLKENPQLTNDCIAHLLRLTALENLQVHETSIDQEGLDLLFALPDLRDLCIHVLEDNYSYEGLLALSARMPQCAILAKGLGEFRDGEFHGTWR